MKGKPGDVRVCKNCGKSIFWMEEDMFSRWTHGASRNNWEGTLCKKIAKSAEPSESSIIQSVLNYYNTAP